MDGIICGQCVFYNDFDSANLFKVESIPSNESVISKQNTNSILPEIPDAEFNIWTKPDCHGTEYENGNRTWFYFGMKANEPSMLVRFNLVDLNRQGKMYSQGMAPVYRILPGKPLWDRVRDKPMYSLNNDVFTLTFKFRTSENVQSTTYFAFTYPFSYVDLEKMLVNIDLKYLTMQPANEDDVYYTRECVCTSLEGRNIDLITITSYHGITSDREERLTNLFPNTDVPRPHKFLNKKIIFISARVHPGETPSSFVFNGLLSQLTNREDLIGITLRRLYVFKLIPFLNPDGVARGHYRTDTRGVNLNRVYRNPTAQDHPSVYAARALIRYYHFGSEIEDVVEPIEITLTPTTAVEAPVIEPKPNDIISQKVSHMTLEEGDSKSNTWCIKCKSKMLDIEGTTGISGIIPKLTLTNTLGCDFCRNCGTRINFAEDASELVEQEINTYGDINKNASGLFLYVDLHGHASKKGIFMYGNHFNNVDQKIDCMLLPKIMSLNNHNFHFNSCNFSERNMYLRDKRDGMSRAGSGRVAVLSLTGIVRSYTLECNYNSGRIINVLPPTIKENTGKVHTLSVPPKYTPQSYEEVGKSLCASILDLTAQNPYTRLPNSEFHSVSGIREWLRNHCINQCNEVKCKVKTKASCTQGKSNRGSLLKSKPTVKKLHCKSLRPTIIPTDRKENVLFEATTLAGSSQPGCSSVATKSSSTLRFGLKTKSRKDILLKDKPKAILSRSKQKLNVASQKVRLDLSSGCSKARMKQDKMIEKQTDSAVQLREICFLKNSEVVGWDAANPSAQIYTHKSRITSPSYAAAKSSAEAGPSSNATKTGGGVFRMHNFGKNSKSKLKKHTLRKLASANEADKKKKKLKVK